MSLNQETIEQLLKIKTDIEEILADVGNVMPEDFRMTCVLRYVGPIEGIQDMIWTDDVHHDVIASLNKYGDEE